MNNYLGVNVTKRTDGRFKLTQPHLIQQILDGLGFTETTIEKLLPASSTKLLSRDLEGTTFDDNWYYRAIIGKMNFLEKSIRLDIGYATHQCARFSINPKESRGKADKYIGWYLKGTKYKGLIIDPKDYYFDDWVDADHSGDWKFSESEDDPTTAKSRTGYIITFAKCPIVWHSKLEGEISLSTTEAEYISLSDYTRGFIPLMVII